MAGVKGRSGRPPGSLGPGYEETLTRRRTPIAPSESDRTKTRIILALKDHDKYDLRAYLRKAFSVDEVTGIQVERILANMEHMKVGVLSRAIIEELDPELWILNNFRGPGKFCFKPVVDGVWIGPMKVQRLGTADSDPILDDQGDVDATLARVLKRESSLTTVRQLQALNAKTTGGTDDMKPGEMVELLKAMLLLRGESSDTATLREEVRSLRESLARPQPNLLDQLQPLLPLLTPLMGGVSKSLVARIVTSFLPREPEPAPIIEAPPPSLVDSLRSILEQPAMQAMLMPLMQMVTTKLQTVQTIPIGGSLTPAPTLTSPGGMTMATFKTDDPDINEAITYIVLAVGERRFSDAYATFQAFPEMGQAFIGAITPGVDAFPFMMRLRTLDDRLRTMPENLRDFVKHVQTQIEMLLEAQQQAERETTHEEEPPA